MKSVLWRVVKRLSYIEDARCLKVKHHLVSSFTESGDTRWCINKIRPPDDEHDVARNM